MRTRIVDAYENGEGSIREVAERFVVSPGTVQSYVIGCVAAIVLAAVPIVLRFGLAALR